jgi:hypothetical protein
MEFSGKKLVARVPNPDTTAKYNWLVIDYDEDYTNGFYLFICGKDPDDVLVDHWFTTEGEARAFARVKLNVQDADWEACKRNLDRFKEMRS